MNKNQHIINPIEYSFDWANLYLPIWYQNRSQILSISNVSQEIFWGHRSVDCSLMRNEMTKCLDAQVMDNVVEINQYLYGSNGKLLNDSVLDNNVWTVRKYFYFLW